jgi:small GTP-binding protein
LPYWEKGVGKTSLLISYTSQSFASEGVPEVLDSITKIIDFKGQKVSFTLFDTSGESESLSHPQIDVILQSYSISSPESLSRIKSHWIPLIEQHAPGVPILCGTKKDSRASEEFKQTSSSNSKLVSPDEATELNKEMIVDAVVE